MPPFTMRSIEPPSPMWRPLRTSRSKLNSRPRKKSRKMSPSPARKLVTSDGWTNESTSGSFGPSSNPARMYAGIAESPKRLATSPSTARTATVTASCSRVRGPSPPAAHATSR